MDLLDQMHPMFASSALRNTSRTARSEGVYRLWHRQIGVPGISPLLKAVLNLMMDKWDNDTDDSFLMGGEL